MLLFERDVFFLQGRLPLEIQLGVVLEFLVVLFDLNLELGDSFSEFLELLGVVDDLRDDLFDDDFLRGGRVGEGAPLVGFEEHLVGLLH